MSARSSPWSSSARSDAPRSRAASRALAARAFGALAAIAVALLAPHGAAAQVEPPTPAEEAMDALSEGFRAIELALGASDLAAAGEAARGLRAELGARKAIATLAPRSLEDVFGASVARTARATEEIEALAAAGSLTGAGQAFDELRASCVACHVRFRSQNDVRGLYPASDNTIAGAVVLRDVDGAPREDRGWVLAFLEGPPLDPPYVHERARPRVGQIGRRFDPRVLPVTVGTEVEFPNDDTIFHNVFSLSKAAPFDLGVYQPGESASVRMERTGLVKVYCNIHPEMASSIVVLDNPWFALTDRTGQFVICGVPDGAYVLRAWNDMGAEARTPIEVAGSRVLTAEIDLRETRRSLAHDDKHGNPYRTRGYR